MHLVHSSSLAFLSASDCSHVQIELVPRLFSGIDGMVGRSNHLPCHYVVCYTVPVCAGWFDIYLL